MLDLPRLRDAYERAKSDLLAERVPGGWWVGELSSSALSTATAVSALAVVRGSGVGGRRSEIGGQAPLSLPLTTHHSPPLDSLISRGIAWLIRHQNDDGGFGDTDLSHSNIATTMLVVAALHLASVAEEHRELLARANAYIDSKGRLDGLRKRYGIDKTFVVPIMTNCAIAGLIDWKEIDPLPFELACVPQSLYRFVGMPVVSYAIPALVAIGQAVYHHAPPWNPALRLIRWLSITRSLRVLRRMQPDSGGYLEATPLTSFVVMSLASIQCGPPQCGPLAPRVDKSGLPLQESLRQPSAQPPSGNSRSELPTLAHDVIREGVKFLANSIRPDGSWPIDTNLATWNTTLSINALAGAGEDVAELLGGPPQCGPPLRGRTEPQESPAHANDRSPNEPLTPDPSPAKGEGRKESNLLDWLLSCQHNKRHPFTGADPGGFGWSDLSGAVPDADDTPGALLAIGALISPDSLIDKHDEKFFTVGTALTWAFKLQNKDGGWPTFCRGWGKLPFDRSGTDLTAHVLRAIQAWSPFLLETVFVDRGEQLDSLIAPMTRAKAFLNKRQHPDGSWSPLWFGNQDRPDEDNPVYGTAKVLMAYRDLGLMDSPEAKRGVAWLVANQNADGGWGSGVWGKVRSAECGVRNEGEAMTGQPVSCHSVLSTQYSVPSTESEHNSSTPQSTLRTPHLTSSVEETALAVEALLAACPRNAAEGVPYNPTSDPRSPTPDPRPPIPDPLLRGLSWLIDRVEAGQHRQPAPIGFYFAKLWYYEKLYPIIFTVAALGRAYRQFSHPAQTAAQTSPPPARSP